MTSQPFELLASITRGGPLTLGEQIEDQIRRAIRAGSLRPGARIPSTRDLARQLGVSRPIVVTAYLQLAAEGYLALTQGSRPRVSATVSERRRPATPVSEAAPAPQFDLRASIPDLSAFPRAAWLRASREALAHMTHDDLGYTDPHGNHALRRTLAEYLGRSRGVIADPASVVITSGFAQGRGLVSRALHARGARHIAVEDPGYNEWQSITRAGLKLVPIAMDQDGMRVDALERSNADAVLLTPAHHFPTGVVMSGERRTALLAWLRARDVVAIEDDYDAEFRYDRSPVGALQGLDPDHVVYAGTASKTLAPGLRLGWLVLPGRMLAAVRTEQLASDQGCPRIEQRTLAEFIGRGDLDRHLRRMRIRYAARRSALVEALATELPEAKVRGIAAGLHAMVQLPEDYDEAAIRVEAGRRGIDLDILSEHRIRAREWPPALLIGYARSPEPSIRIGVRELAAAIRQTRFGR